MSKHTVVFIRHAKADSAGFGTDEKRVLTAPGFNQAKKLGAELCSYIQGADTVFVSPAVRAKQTWNAIVKGADVDPNGPKIRTEDVIYAGDAMQILETLRLESSGYTSIVVGHEPTISAVAKLVVKENQENKLLGGMKTGSAAIVSWNKNWKEWHSHVANLDDLIRVGHK